MGDFCLTVAPPEYLASSLGIGRRGIRQAFGSRRQDVPVECSSQVAMGALLPLALPIYRREEGRAREEGAGQGLGGVVSGLHP